MFHSVKFDSWFVFFLIFTVFPKRFHIKPVVSEGRNVLVVSYGIKSVPKELDVTFQETDTQ